MQSRANFPITVLLAATLFFAVNVIAVAAPAAVIVSPSDATAVEQFAAREVQRYVYVRTGELLPIQATAGESATILVSKTEGLLHGGPDVDRGVLATAKDLGEQDYLLRTVRDSQGRSVVYLIGGSDIATLYAAYRFAEYLGIRFYLHGDVIPDEQIPLSLPDLDEKGSPLFHLRGIQPFHDFPEGPDWWNADNYKAIIGQLPKLRMNFIGLHTYPENRPNAEPTVWIGRPEDFEPDGGVAFSYPASYYNTALNVNWGFQPRKTSDYFCGAAALFDRDDFGSEVMHGLTPVPQDPEACNEVFERAGTLLRESFQLASKLGVKTCVGTETPLVVPQRVQDRMGESAPGSAVTESAVTESAVTGSARLQPGEASIENLYAGIFSRIMNAYPIDYYWFWTPEGWTWEGTTEEDTQKTIEDILAAKAAAERVDAPFQLATCGWVLGPQFDRAYLDKALPKDFAVSCISRAVGHDPVEPAFAEIADREKWAIPWLEDDPAMTSPQLWVGRMRRDARDALDYGCTGLMGIHWRTRILGPNVAALAQAAWDQSGWTEPETQTGPLGGRVAQFGQDFADTDDDALYRSVRYDMSAYRMVVPDGRYTVTLHFCEPYYREPGKRVFGYRVEHTPPVEHLDVFAAVGPDRAVLHTIEDVTVDDGILDINFIKEMEFPCIAAIEVVGGSFTQRINCGGEAYNDFIVDPDPVIAGPLADDFYRDWAEHEFGPEVGEDAARIFSAVDGKLPRPSNWIGGPGGYTPDDQPWDAVKLEYAFVDDLAALRDRISTPGNRARFDYWLNTFEYLRASAKVRCAWGEFNAAMKTIKGETDPTAKSKLARESALPRWTALIDSVREMYGYLLATVNTTGEMGTVCNWEQHTFPALLDETSAKLTEALGEPVSPDAQLTRTYEGEPRIIVPAIRTAISPGEDLVVPIIVLDSQPPREVLIHYRPLGTENYMTKPAEHLGRNTYQVTIPAKDFSERGLEYHLQATTHDGKTIQCSAAGTINQTVILNP